MKFARIANISVILIFLASTVATATGSNPSVCGISQYLTEIEEYSIIRLHRKNLYIIGEVHHQEKFLNARKSIALNTIGEMPVTYIGEGMVYGGSSEDLEKDNLQLPKEARVFGIDTYRSIVIGSLLKARNVAYYFPIALAAEQEVIEENGLEFFNNTTKRAKQFIIDYILTFLVNLRYQKFDLRDISVVNDFSRDVEIFFSKFEPVTHDGYEIGVEVFGTLQESKFGSPIYLEDMMEYTSAILLYLSEQDVPSFVKDSLKSMIENPVDTDFPLVLHWRNQVMAENVSKIIKHSDTNETYIFVGSNHRRGLVANIINSFPEAKIVRHNLTNRINARQEEYDDLLEDLEECKPDGLIESGTRNEIRELKIELQKLRDENQPEF